jgi:MFS superfamily sulfate permease-like transporter
VVGGKGKWSQLTVALLTLSLFFVGPQIINFVPRLIGRYKQLVL